MSSLHRLARQSFLHRRLLHPRALPSISDRNHNPSTWKTEEEEDATSIDRNTPVRAKLAISHIFVTEHDIDATFPSKMKVEINRHPHLIGLVDSIPQSKASHTSQISMKINERGVQDLSCRYLLARGLNTHSDSSCNKPGNNVDGRREMLNRLLYRSRQRGYLELDLILGKWTEENIEKLDEEQLKSLVEVLDLENPELWKWLTGQEAAPESLKANPVFVEIHEKILRDLKNHSPSETRAKLGQPWVRGWDDNRKVGGPQVGNQ